MSTAETLAALARGDAAAARAVLHTCRTAAFGAAAYGREESAALFRAAPLELDAGNAVATATLAALFGRDGDGRDAALFADLHDGRVTRLWALANRRLPAAPIDDTGVPFDLDLDQRGGRFLFDPNDHPALDADAVEPLRRLGQEWLDGQPAAIVGPLERVRPVLLRAASAGGRTAALTMLQGLAGAGGIARFAVGTLVGEGQRVVVDEAGRAAAIARRRVVELRPRDPAPAAT